MPIRTARLFAVVPMLALVLLCFPGAAGAKDGGRITGKVLGPDGQALIGAVITIFKEDRNGGTILYTRTDRRGDYNLRDVAPGNYSLHVNQEGFKPLVKPALSIASGRTTTLNVILLELLEFIASDDPRNWNLTTVLRSTSDRRLIFRALEDAGTDVAEAQPRFERNAAVNLTSSTGLSGADYVVYPSRGFGGVASNFAYSEPVSQNTRMIFAGQLSAGYDSLWRVRNTFHYQPQTGRDIKFSLGYGRQNPAAGAMGALAGPSQFFASDPSVRDSGVETVSVGFTSSDQLMDILSIEYGLDLFRIRQGSTRSVVSPHFRLQASPAQGWLVRTVLASKRTTDANSVELPDGEIINLMEPVYITKINGNLTLSQLQHAEIAAERQLGKRSSAELAVYQDSVTGRGIPLAMIYQPASAAPQHRLGLLGEEGTTQRGIRLSMRRQLLDSLSGAASYVYAGASSLDGSMALVPGNMTIEDLSEHIRRSYFHSLMGSVDARLARTQTHLTATLRWHPGNPVTPIDLFSSQTDIQNKGVAFCIRQLIPMPEFLYGAGQWIALVDVRNAFDQGKYVIPAGDGVIILTPNPRYIRFGLNLNFN